MQVIFVFVKTKPHKYCLCFFVWQVSNLHWCPPWYRRCPLHVLPLLYFCSNRKMSCADNPAVQTPYCGVDELCDCITFSPKGASSPACYWSDSVRVGWPVFCNVLNVSVLIGFPLHQGNILSGWGDGTAHYMGGAISVLPWCKCSLANCSQQGQC